MLLPRSSVYIASLGPVDIGAMRFNSLIAVLAALLWASYATNDGLTDVVEWDPYSLVINGDRVFILYVL